MVVLHRLATRSLAASGRGGWFAFWRCFDLYALVTMLGSYICADERPIHSDAAFITVWAFLLIHHIRVGWILPLSLYFLK